MAAHVNPPRGMRDFLPNDKAKRERVLGIIRDTYRRHGFDEVETPVMEESSRLHAGLGGDNEKLAFAVMRRGLTGDDVRTASDPLDLADLGLRFDLTVPLTRFYASHRAELPPVFRAIQIGPVWRAERPQKGRYRQFVQCDIDIVGEEGALAEAELLLASLNTFESLGLSGVTIRINDRRILTGMLNHFGFPEEQHASTLITLDKLDKIGPEGVLAELDANGAAPDALALLGSYLLRPQTREFIPFGERQIRAALPEGFDSPAVAHLVELGGSLTDALAASRVSTTSAGGSGDKLSGDSLPLHFDPFLVRGMGYYTGTIFEAAHPQLGYSLGGGGRYDTMIGRFLGAEVPAVGFSIGFERIIDLLDPPADDAPESIALLHETDAPLNTLIALKARLVAEGHRARLERARKNRKVQLSELAASGFTHFAVVPAGLTVATVPTVELELRALSQ